MLEGIDDLDPHIGANELHRRCYDQLQRNWHKWSGGYHVPIENTTLRGVKILAAIAGKDLLGPAKERDAILGFFLKPRGKTNEVIFKPGEVELALVIDEADYMLASRKREEVFELTEDGIMPPHKVCRHDLVYVHAYRSPCSIDQQQRT